ncbi:hypothetical protein [Demequina sp.]|uniref:hypothetical protein n=1 Tax=Demequina sp. TaxID=2050685 RepID=UPI003A89AA69
MDDLGDRLRGEYETLRSDVSERDVEVYAAVRSGARRRRQVRGMLTASVAVLGVAAVGAGAWGITSVMKEQPEPAGPGLTHSPTDGPTGEPVTSTSPEPAVTEDPRADDSADGIAEDALPAMAAQRESAATNDWTSDPYPQAHVMEDWVWDFVGEGWSLDIASEQWYPYDDAWVQPAAVLYLISPEDVHFELFELPERAWDDARVTSWREDQDTAMIWWSEKNDGSRYGKGGAVNLRTGALDDLVMSVNGETAHHMRFVTANAAGDELWRAESSAGFKYYRWSDGADEDGWVASALVDQVPDADDLGSETGVDEFTVAEGGDRVFLRPTAEVTRTQTDLTVVTYDLAADKITSFPFTGLPPGARFQFARIADSETLYGWLMFPDTTADNEHTYDAVELEFTLDGTGSYSTATEAPESGGSEVGGPVGYGLASPLGAGSEACGC